jgi:hypothetical protein
MTSKSYEATMPSRSVRELGGEIWAELSTRIDDRRADWKTKNEVVDVVMGVLARHAGKVLVNDEGMPVAPLPTT